ncbi:MAG TPA: chemotaxis response regulator protein-glutamate methylesterase [Sediminispirochaeta sp.]|nr:chemotaxis response regulator protein-glutamate methylesterase [Sediminispirochaeta sp.]
MAVENVQHKIKVLVIDDSALARKILMDGLSRDPEIEVVGSAPDVYVARDKIVYQKPDVLTLDVEMPRMDGVEFLRRLMPQYPLPVIMVSALTTPGAQVTLEALEYGAIDFVAKPSTSFGNKLEQMLDELIHKIKLASTIDVSRWKDRKVKKGKKPQSAVLTGSTDKVIGIGASTGGTVALRTMIEAFPPDMPGTVIVQHMPPKFTKMFADKLNSISKVEVKEAEDQDRILKGRVLIAPGGMQMSVVRSGGIYQVRVKEGEKVNGHAPSVDVLFRSMAQYVGSNAVGVILTGMGRDGADGMWEMKNNGARTLGQNESSCVVFGMPKEAYQKDAVEKLLPIEDMTLEVVKLLREMK